MSASLLVIAKEPVPGRSKTRLTPPCTPDEAAALAEAALADTLAAVVATEAPRRVVVLEGTPGIWLPPEVEVIGQRGRGLAQRLAYAFADAGAPALLIGMDTPQVTPELLREGLDALDGGASAVFGPAADGGYWAIGLARVDARVFAGIPMSDADTGSRQLERLRELGHDPVILPELRDVDVIADAQAVAQEAPLSRFATRLAESRQAAR